LGQFGPKTLKFSKLNEIWHSDYFTGFRQTLENLENLEKQVFSGILRENLENSGNFKNKHTFPGKLREFYIFI
jgi:hypothetical protein